MTERGSQKTRWPRTVFAIAVPVMGAACGRAGTGSVPAAWSGTIRDSAGIAIVSNPADGTWTDADRWTVTDELRIGTRTGDRDYQFGQISGIAELSDGRLAVMDAQAQQLRIFSSDGTYEATIGGPGDGPGEFGPAAGPVLIGPGDSVYVPDPSNARLHRLSPDARPLGTSPLDLSAGLPLAWLDTPEGLLVSQMRPFAFPGQPAADSTDLILAWAPDGTATDTVIRFPSGRTFGTREDGLPDIRFFSAEPSWAITSTGRFVYGYSDAYRFGIYEDRRLTRIVEKPYSREPVSQSDQALLKEAMSRLWKDSGMLPEVLQVMTDAIGFAELYPARGPIRGGPAGSIWVQHLQTPSDLPAGERDTFDPQLGFGGPDWDVFDPEGRFLGVLELPERYQPLRIDGDRLYGVLRDALDVQYVLVLRVNRSREGLEAGGG